MWPKFPFFLQYFPLQILFHGHHNIQNILFYIILDSLRINKAQLKSPQINQTKLGMKEPIARSLDSTTEDTWRPN
jgi:hypothetical protein